MSVLKLQMYEKQNDRGKEGKFQSGLFLLPSWVLSHQKKKKKIGINKTLPNFIAPIVLARGSLLVTGINIFS